MQPAAGVNVPTTVTSAAGLSVGQGIFIAGGGYYTIATIAGLNVTLTNLGLAGNAAVGANVPIASAISSVVPGYFPVTFAGTLQTGTVPLLVSSTPAVATVNPTFVLSFAGYTPTATVTVGATPAITQANLQAAVNSLLINTTSPGSGNGTAVVGPITSTGNYLITFGNALADVSVPLLDASPVTASAAIVNQPWLVASPATQTVAVSVIDSVVPSNPSTFNVSFLTGPLSPTALTANLAPVTGGTFASLGTYYYVVTANVNLTTIAAAGSTQPAVGANVTVTVVSSSALGVGQVIVVAGSGHYRVASVNSSTSVTLTNLGSPGNAGFGTPIANGANVSVESIASNTAAAIVPSAVPGPSSQEVTLAWSAVGGAASYNIYRASASGGFGANSLVAAGVVPLTYIDTGSATIAGTPPGTTVTIGSVAPTLNTAQIASNAATTTSASYTQPAAGGTVSVSVVSTIGMTGGQGLSSPAAVSTPIASVTNGTTVVLTNLGSAGNAAPATVIGAGASVTSVFTGTTAAFTQPAAGSTVSVSVVSSANLLAGQELLITGGGFYSVASVTNATTVVLTNLGSTGNAIQGAPIAIGASVTTLFTQAGYYYYVVTAIVGGVESVASDELSVIMTNNVNATVNLSWSPVPNATGYNIYRATASGAYTALSLLNAAPQAATVYFDTGAPAVAGAPPVTGTRASLQAALNALLADAGRSGLHQRDDALGGTATVDETVTGNFLITFGGTLSGTTVPLLIATAFANNAGAGIINTGATAHAGELIQGGSANATPTQWFASGPSPVANAAVNLEGTTNKANIAGPITSIVSDPNDPNIIYITTAGGGTGRPTTPAPPGRHCSTACPPCKTSTSRGWIPAPTPTP